MDASSGLPAQAWIIQIILGGILGMTGQGLRVVAGMKKINDSTEATQKSLGDLFVLHRLLISLLTGFIGGVIAILVMGKNFANPDVTQMLGVIAAGYAGSDFIDAFIQKYLPVAGVQTVPQGGNGGAVPDRVTPAGERGVDGGERGTPDNSPAYG